MNFCDCFDFGKRLSLYVHIPFCVEKCSYCAFYSGVCHDEAEKQGYVDRITSEINGLVSKMRGKAFYTAYIGGGNPGCLSVRQLGQIAEAVCKNGRPVEFTTEMNPESLTAEHCVLFENYFTRLSMGVQSLNEEALEFLGRNSSLEETLKGIRISQALKQKTGTKLSYDLITCLPDWHDSKKDIHNLLGNYDCDHISIYALTLEEGTPLYKKQPILPDADRQYEILKGISRTVKEYGFEQYEVSNYSKNGQISVHNSVYWDYEQYAGIGSGAASTGFADGKVYRIEASRSVKNYEYGISELSKEESLEEFVFMGLRHSIGLNLSRLENDYGKTLKSLPDGFSVEGNRLVPDFDGLMTADNAALRVISDL